MVHDGDSSPFPLGAGGWAGGRGLLEPTPPGADLPLPSLSPWEERREAFSDGFGGLGGGDAAGGRAGGRAAGSGGAAEPLPGT